MQHNLNLPSFFLLLFMTLLTICLFLVCGLFFIYFFIFSLQGIRCLGHFFVSI